MYRGCNEVILYPLLHDQPTQIELNSSIKVFKFDTMADFVVPGQPITSEAGFLRGHGAYIQYPEGASNLDAGAGVLISSVAGRIERVNKLISVKSIRARLVIMVFMINIIVCASGGR